MILWLKNLLGGVWAYVAAGALAVVLYAAWAWQQRRIGADRVRSRDREKIAEAQTEKRRHETAIRGLGPDAMRERVRRQRDQLRELLRPR